MAITLALPGALAGLMTGLQPLPPLPLAITSAATAVTDAIAAGQSTGTLNLALNAGAIAPEAAVLLALIACLLVDLAGEKEIGRAHV